MNSKVRLGLASLLIILFQSTLKIVGVLITRSVSFLSETIDTVVDLFFVMITLYFVYKSEKPPDLKHMYGHSKLDSISAIIQGIILSTIYVLLIYNSIIILIEGVFEIVNPGLGLILLIISFLVNLIFSRILIWQGNKKKSLTLKIQGLNLFQDSLRAVMVFISLIFALFNLLFFDPIFSIILSIWIIIASIRLTNSGIKELSDTNPVSSLILEEIRFQIFELEHVNGIQNIKIRAWGNTLVLEVTISVEDHISIVHANRIIKSIRMISNERFPNYDVECIIQMNPLSSESSLGSQVYNLISSKQADFGDIVKIENINLYSITEETYLSFNLIVDNRLSLYEAHKISSQFENELKEEAPFLNRIISHIEASEKKEIYPEDSIKYECFDTEEMENFNNSLKKVLENYELVKGFHGLECWKTLEHSILEFHAFFDGDINISEIHDFITKLELSLRSSPEFKGFEQIIIHSEPYEGRKDGIMFS